MSLPQRNDWPQEDWEDDPDQWDDEDLVILPFPVDEPVILPFPFDDPDAEWTIVDRDPEPPDWCDLDDTPW